MEYKYNWDKYPDVKKFLDDIYVNTKKQLININYDESNAQRITSYVEDYLVSLIEFKYNINDAIANLNSLKYISFEESLLIQNKKRIESFPPFMDFGNRIFLDSNIKDYDMQRYYLYQALTTRILNFRNNDTQSFSKIYSNEIQSNKKFEASILVDSGWLLLEEALSMEIARKFTAFSTQKNIFIPSVSNEYLDILLLFGMTINNTCSSECHSKEIIIYNLVKIAFNESFTSKVIKEYIAKGKEFELYQLLFIMGHLLNRKTKRFPNYKASDDEIKRLTIELYEILRNSITLGKEEFDKEIEIKPKKLALAKKNKLTSLINKNI